MCPRHSIPNANHVFGVLEWFFMFSEKHTFVPKSQHLHNLFVGYFPHISSILTSAELWEGVYVVAAVLVNKRVNLGEGGKENWPFLLLRIPPWGKSLHLLKDLYNLNKLYYLLGQVWLFCSNSVRPNPTIDSRAMLCQSDCIGSSSHSGCNAKRFDCKTWICFPFTVLL